MKTLLVILLSWTTPESLNDGLVITIVGYSIVFSSLVILFFIFSYLSKLLNMKLRQKLRREGKHDIADLQDIDISGEVTAAISMAIYLCKEVHDEESNVITIKRTSKTYSPWSSKIYGLRRYSR